MQQRYQLRQTSFLILSLSGSQTYFRSRYEAVPLLGKYSSMDAEVFRQQIFWMVETGVTDLLVVRYM